MDAYRLDTLARLLATAHSRRRALAAVAGSLGLLGWRPVANIDAHNPLTRCKKKSGKQKRACVKKAKTHNATHGVALPTCTPSCATANACGSNGCGGSCGSCTGGACRGGICTCRGGEEPCRGGCVAACRATEDRNPLDCTCCTAHTQSCDPFDSPGAAPCCSGECKPRPDIVFIGACEAIPTGEPCDFAAQCASDTCAQGQCIDRPCKAGDNVCFGHNIPCGKGCGCHTTIGDQTRCGHAGTFVGCIACASDAEYQAAPHNVPGAFCSQGGGFCCPTSEKPGFCLAPCPD